MQNSVLRAEPAQLHGDFARWQCGSPRFQLSIAGLSFRGRRYLEVTLLDDGQARGGPQIRPGDAAIVAHAIDVAKSGGQLDWSALESCATTDVATEHGTVAFRARAGRPRVIPPEHVDDLEAALGWLLEGGTP
ncbi:MAG TPA: hypothetical protein VE987_22245 [Polyangiaceae bacterium]|nr:hypothetical protein [Polyangiaceae bacterium]